MTYPVSCGFLFISLITGCREWGGLNVGRNWESHFHHSLPFPYSLQEHNFCSKFLLSYSLRYCTEPSGKSLFDLRGPILNIRADSNKGIGFCCIIRTLPPKKTQWLKMTIIYLAYNPNSYLCGLSSAGWFQFGPDSLMPLCSAAKWVEGGWLIWDSLIWNCSSLLHMVSLSPAGQLWLVHMDTEQVSKRTDRNIQDLLKSTLRAGILPLPPHSVGQSKSHSILD